ncbi:MAG: hypothetical protein IKM08_04980 [Clostridia bacterium]|nr:hypothetical protein [Clostridia bacterium]
MKKETATFHLIVNTVFIGILLSFAIVYLTTMLVGTDAAEAPACYDGTVISGEDPGSSFRRAVYQNEQTLSFIREYQYKLFGIADQSSVTIGERNFLFELHNDAYHYNYLDDYTGNLSFTEEELAQILDTLQQREALCSENGARYLLVIIPNSQSVYSEYMPSYLGRMSSHTRLSRMTEYLSRNGFYYHLNLTDHLKSAKKDGWLYNNTENSLNARGSYYTYLTVCSRISSYLPTEIHPIERDTLTFFQHATTGKKTAEKAGVAEFAFNRTVSLSNDTPILYDISMNSNTYLSTRLKEGGDSGTSVLLQFSDSVTRSQSEIFFSNTIPEVVYQNRLSLSEETFQVASPRVVVQFIAEHELSRLLP